MIEEAKLKKLEDERLSNEELERLTVEESKLEVSKRNYEESLLLCLKQKIEDEDWKRYSYCDEGYINVRKEKDLNGFVYDFKERCDFVSKLFINSKRPKIFFEKILIRIFNFY